MAKPNEFYVGVLDFFAILLPGAIATALLEPRWGEAVATSFMHIPSSEAARWAAFLAVSYFVGHLVFLVGSWIDPLYNKIRERFHPYGNESAFQCATRVRDSMIGEGERKALNTFQWSRSMLISKCPLAAEDVHRLEADSKFFRSLLVVSVLAGVVFRLGDHALAAAIAFAFTVPCFVRYYERRLKSTTQAYQHIVALHSSGALTAPPEAASD